MKRSILLLALAAGSVAAQDIKLNGAIELWYTQMLDHNLRLNGTPTSAGTGTGTYFQLNSAFKENGFTVRRCEIYLNGKLTPDLTWGMMLDPNTSTSTGKVTGNTPTILNDAWIDYKFTPAFSVRAGQMKPYQTFEAFLVRVPEMLFYDRSMHGRQFGDKRDRGVVLTYAFGDPKAFGGKAHVGVFNGSSDYDGGKSNDRNAQKDWVARLDFAYDKTHRFGAYFRTGETDAADTQNTGSKLLPGTGWPASPQGPSAAEILDNRDKTTNLGAYYVFETPEWYASVEGITGLLGRRYPTIFNTSAAAWRQHLDQKYLGYTLTGVYKMGRHWFTARYDVMDYNAGDDWYTATNPYKDASGDFSPHYTEAIVGYNLMLDPMKYVTGALKVNYIWRSKNFLNPRANQSGEQGGDSLVVSFKVGF